MPGGRGQHEFSTPTGTIRDYRANQAGLLVPVQPPAAREGLRDRQVTGPALTLQQLPQQAREYLGLQGSYP
jgi:hypothetical protein